MYQAVDLSSRSPISCRNKLQHFITGKFFFENTIFCRPQYDGDILSFFPSSVTTLQYKARSTKKLNVISAPVSTTTNQILKILEGKTTVVFMQLTTKTSSGETPVSGARRTNTKKRGDQAVAVKHSIGTFLRKGFFAFASDGDLFMLFDLKQSNEGFCSRGYLSRKSSKQQTTSPANENKVLVKKLCNNVNVDISYLQK